MLPVDFPRLDDLGVDAAVLAFALAVTLATSVVFGLLPVWHVRRLNLVETLAEDGTAPVGSGVRSRAARTRLLIMSVQVAIACVLLVGASLLGRSFVSLVTADRGFDPTAVLSARLAMPAAIYRSEEQRFGIIERMLDRLCGRTRGDGGGVHVRAAADAGRLDERVQPASPRSPAARSCGCRRRRGSSAHATSLHSAFRTIAGRGFSDLDTESSEPVVVVNQSFARRYLGGDPIGARLPTGAYARPGEPARAWTVIGVVEDVRYVTATDSSQPELYYSYRQMGGRLPVQTVTLLARTSGAPGASATALRAAVREADDRLVADAVMPLEQRLLTSLARPRLYAVLLGGFAGCALVIAAVGLFGVLSYSVSLRTRELAIRAALGASRREIVRLVLGQGLSVTLGGIAAGMLASAWLTRVLTTQLYGVTAHDPLTFALVPLVLLAVGALACLLPARRAARLDPQRTLRGG